MQNDSMPGPEDAEDSPDDLAPRDGVLALYGYGIKILVERGQLLVTDGIGASRRRGRFARATHGLRRLVVVGHSGYISVDALAWCDRLNISVVVLDSHDGHPSFGSFPRRTDDARLRRAQARAAVTPVGLAIARDLLKAKLAGQAALLRDRLRVFEAANAVEALSGALDAAATIGEARQLEAAAAVRYWQAWVHRSETTVRFARKDLGRVPDHWLRFDGRRSVLASANGNRRAERPVNAILNFCYSLAEAEALRACLVVGLDPGLGLLHLDATNRASMALDLMEPIRPEIETYVFDLLAQHTFRDSDFAENNEGHVRLLPPITLALAKTLPVWGKAIAPWAERVAHVLGEGIGGKYKAATPLTGANLRHAQDSVRLRKARAGTLMVLAAAAPVPKQVPSGEAKPPLTRTCLECGVIVKRASHQRCPECWVGMPGQDVETRARRGRGIAASRAELDRWRRAHPGAAAGPEEFRTEILPLLAGVPLQEIMDACGVAKSTASTIRSGRHVPALRHWAALRELLMLMNSPTAPAPTGVMPGQVAASIDVRSKVTIPPWQSPSSRCSP